jgi:tripartite-type tricarboxylate transporter receptor subunit TctC
MQVLNLTRLPRASKISYFSDRLLGQIQEGKLLVLAVTSHEGMLVPVKAPSVSEPAIPGYEYNTWFGFVAPAKVPAPILERLARAIKRVAGEAEVRKKLLDLAIIPRTLTLQEFDSYVKSDIEKQAQIADVAEIERH